MIILETDRLILREVTINDAKFIFELLNDPLWLRFIGDKHITDLDAARDYILNGPIKSYKTHGFGLFLTKLKNEGLSIGLCGLIKRDNLPHADVGFAFLPQFRGKGYATESASAVLNYGKTVLGLKQIVGITALDNDASIHVLEKLGLRFQKIVQIFDDGSESKLFVPDI